MKPAIFYFNFYNENTEENHFFGFEIKNIEYILSKINKNNFEEMVGHIYENDFDDIESDYGVHDWSTSPSESVDSIGFTSYEIESEHWNTVLEKWRDVFNRLGGECSEIVEINARQSMQGDDMEIYKTIKDSIERKRPAP